MATPRVSERQSEYLRFKWSHHLGAHRIMVRLYNRVLRRVPFQLKYGIGKQLRKGAAPYGLVREGDIVVQVGAPSDTLHAGRSRAMFFALFVGDSGRVVVMEPDPTSVEALRSLASARGLRHVEVCPFAAWHEKTQLELLVNPAHPAANFTAGRVDYGEDRMREFDRIRVDANTVDNVLAAQGIERVNLLSITTNGAERDVLRGAAKTIAAGLPFICLARTGEGYESVMQELGYRLYSHDDRGFTFEQVDRKAGTTAGA